MKRIFLFATLFVASNLLFASENSKLKSKNKSAKHAQSHCAVAGQAFTDPAELAALGLALAEEHALDSNWVAEVLGRAKYLPGIAKLMLPPPTGSKKNWQVYRNRFVEPIRIQAGVRFWHAHQAWLARAQEVYGVPQDIIVGILGVETLYGQHMGEFRVLDALATLSLDFPKAHPRWEARQAFFRAELGHFLVLAKQQALPPDTFKGSFAGAMGQAQFMPSSWRKYAVDFDGDGRIDLTNSAADAIGSVANYFRAFGWQTGLATHFPVQLQGGPDELDRLLVPDILPTFSLANFVALGAQPQALPSEFQRKLALIELQNGTSEPQYVAGTDNFYVITRYNWSSYYAMAVIELGQAVKRQVAGTAPVAVESAPR